MQLLNELKSFFNKKIPSASLDFGSDSKVAGKFAVILENDVLPIGFWTFVDKDTLDSNALKAIPFLRNESFLENQKDKWMYFKEENIRYYDLSEAINESTTHGGINTSGYWEETTKSWKVMDINTRNTDLKNAYAAELEQPIGLHPKLQVNLKNLKPPNKQCTLRGVLYLPSTLFVDQYELSSMAEMRAGNLDQILRIFGETDLEAPTYTLPGTGSILWFQVFLNGTTRHNHDLRLELPLHTRYQLPTKGAVYANTSFYSPSFYWDCSSRKIPIEEESLSNLLFNRFVSPLKSLGPPSLVITIPTANVEHEQMVRWITNTVILGMFFYIVQFLLRKLKGHLKQL
ncbi:pig-X, glycosylphosphatidylinositol-mannosyltransferase I complex subunit [Schizosaccharomyces osmophilus]|uniref:Protein PBN1 n=1 Tax=Schizosaccharomyces osmophilus TaxID=2545709 RepID=A0AAE9WET6_9SCHI|nr:pig-X, glycosylphosphatidylinositol-mannosyltransferase I complex subunit [Schizosaccharomyces osmophilus]WBW75086.1 pig-X, glycosylphosphatidylinositol-mannosyltransferase I complex subunit [Schizosaccharomyces osmophilus]